MDNVERQVWQRVMQPGPAGSNLGLKGLLLAAREQVAVCRFLAGALQMEQARELLRREQANADCLRGLLLLTGTGEEKPKGMAVEKEPARRALEKYFRRSRRAVTEYTARYAEPEFGEVFRIMAQRQGECCALAAELLGKV